MGDGRSPCLGRLPLPSVFIGEAYLQSEAANRTLCLILDVRMPGLSGLELQRLLTDQHSIVPIIFITAFPDERTRQQAIEGGAVCYLSKSYGVEGLLDCIRLAVEQSGNHRAAQ